MKVVVTHTSPDLDAITSVWLIKRYLPGWEDAKVEFVPAGERLGTSVADKNFLVPHSQTARHANSENFISSLRKDISPIEQIRGNDVIHVDTGMGPLDHHQTSSDKVCAASLTWEYVKNQNLEMKGQGSERMKDKIEAIDRIVKVVIDIDHFKELFWENPNADYHDFSLFGVLEGLKLQKMDDDEYYLEFITNCLDALLHEFQNKIWAEREIAENGVEFKTKWGKGIGFSTINDSVIKLAQKMGYVVVLRKDPRKGYVRIKAKPGTNLTLAFEKFKKVDPNATWFLHISKNMLLNGSVKNPKMRPSSLNLGQIIDILKTI